MCENCDASVAPSNGSVGDCSNDLASGATCQPTCDAGYTVSGTSSCTAGALTAALCDADPCDASVPPDNGGAGDCTNDLASGATCQPTCDAGYTVSGTSSCTAGALTAASCDAVCSVVGLSSLYRASGCGCACVRIAMPAWHPTTEAPVIAPTILPRVRRANPPAMPATLSLGSAVVRPGL